jgi:3-isopropylmalate/(R)-2-methylmalate dehydratase large subunit
MTSRPATLYDKLWNSHVVRADPDGTSLLYVDRHLVHEVTSPQAFEGLRLAGRMAWRPQSIVATADHNTPTGSEGVIIDRLSRQQLEALDGNIRAYGAKLYLPFGHPDQGIVHVMAPELGATLPGMTVVCGDSHTSTHGALGCLAFGIGTSEVEHVLATQCLVTKKARSLQIRVEGTAQEHVTAKDVALAVIGAIGAAGAAGHAIEFAGSLVVGLSLAGRMTLCNMSIEAGARCGMVAVDDSTIAYVRDRPFAPKGRQWEAALEHWRTLHSDHGAVFDRLVSLDARELGPQVTWGTSPEMVVCVDQAVPDPSREGDPGKRAGMKRALEYMALSPGTRITDIELDKVFIGSCTNARIEDLRAAAAMVDGKRVSKRVRQALVVSGSGRVKRQAEAEGLARVFVNAGFEWREPGCSMCLAMNGDQLAAGERCASTSNRNFEGRQGAAGRTHLVSPVMAAAAAIEGRFVDVRHWH